MKAKRHKRKAITEMAPGEEEKIAALHTIFSGKTPKERIAALRTVRIWGTPIQEPKADAEIKNSFDRWLEKTRPPGIGFKDERGKTRPEIWKAKLDRLGKLRLAGRATLAKIPDRFPEAAEYFGIKKHLSGTSQEREFYKDIKKAQKDPTESITGLNTVSRKSTLLFARPEGLLPASHG
ncbi:MAG: hypothetical protein HY735_05525 [Verrucomicrobia bacterium]|nr:hypothetical protein [Verrucomicrobiota bacterium]